MKQPSLHRLANIERWSGIEIFLTLLLFSVFLRFPFFFQHGIKWGWDEFTFILMGQSLLDGHLPYTELWDIKPPLNFASFALLIGIFGKSIVGVRIGGLVFVLASAYMTFLTGKHIWGQRTGFLAAIFCVVFTSFGFGGQVVYSEIIASVPLVAALTVGVTRTMNPRTSFLIGLFLSIATLVRMNLAYLCVLVGVYIIVQAVLFKNSLLRNILMYVLGGLLPVALICLLYAVNGHSQTLFDALVTAPLQYANTQLSAFSALIRLYNKTVRTSNALLWIGFLGGIVLTLKNWKASTESQKQGLLFLATFLTGIGFSIINSGAAYLHYVIQMVPFMALLAGQFYLSLYQNISKPLIAFVLLLSLISSATFWEENQRSLFTAYKTIGVKLVNHQPFASGTGYELAEYLHKENPLREPVYLMDFHIAYWLTDTKPLLKVVTQPSNITKDFLVKLLNGPEATTGTVMSELLQIKPLFIVKRKGSQYLKNKPDALAILEKALRTEYALVKNIEKAYIYKRKDATDRILLHGAE